MPPAGLPYNRLLGEVTPKLSALETMWTSRRLYGHVEFPATRLVNTGAFQGIYFENR